ncbi:MAG TPA: hypothetical protein DEP57_04240 [Selenomonas sp.]|nr:hypothetical protein [Selenomonas sp.]
MDKKTNPPRKNPLSFLGWHQAPLSEQDLMDFQYDQCRGMSIRTKITMLLTVALSVFAFASAAISYEFYMETAIAQNERLAAGIANLVAESVDAEKVDEFVDSKGTAEGYDNTLRKLYRIKNTSPLVEYLYVYRIFVKMTHDSVRYMTDIKNKNETIAKMQTALIMTLADMVERRDKNTGHHIRKTAAYVKIIADGMKESGIYEDILTDDFIHNMVESAPLHDVGKITIPDAILNKPGKLTEEEFDLMKSHAAAGGKIIGSLIDTVPDSDYLYEARNLATYHHERWDGTGYPSGLAGEDIPLSSRIMAVADVFDALISTRSYKKGFPYEKALAIIKAESGTHFDPQVVAAFFAVKDKILEVADEFSETED